MDGQKDKAPVEVKDLHKSFGDQTVLNGIDLTVAPGETERLHAVRIALKKLRYAVELGAEAAGERDTDELRTLKHAQDLLGRLHDFQVLIDRIRHLQGTIGHDTNTDRALDAMVDSLENDCRRVHAR